MIKKRYMKYLLALLLVSIAVHVAQYAQYRRMTVRAENLYIENYANDHAATECAVRTGFQYNCSDGTQAISCK
jgi:hypothetical protein